MVSVVTINISIAGGIPAHLRFDLIHFLPPFHPFILITLSLKMVYGLLGYACFNPLPMLFSSLMSSFRLSVISAYVALNGREEGCEDCSPWPIPYIFSGRRVCGGFQAQMELCAGGVAMAGCR